MALMCDTLHSVTHASRRKTLSQNFLKGMPEISQLISAARLEQSDVVVEPGAGEGSITAALAHEVEKVVAWEIDGYHARKLYTLSSRYSNIEVHQGDVRSAALPNVPFKIVGNIPFSITTDLIKLGLSAPSMVSMTVLTQMEVARKRTGSYGNWTKQTIDEWPWHEFSLEGSISRRAFSPAPSVDVGILRIVRRAQPVIPRSQIGAYQNMVRVGFVGKGGSFKRSLTQHFGRSGKTACEEAGIANDRLVGTVTPDEWVLVFKGLARGGRVSVFTS